MSRATCALPPGLRRSNRRAVVARRLPRRQGQGQPEIDEDQELDTENESDGTEGLPALRSGPPAEGLSAVRSPASRALPDLDDYDDQGRSRQREAEMRDELLVRYSGQVPRGPDRPSDRRAMGPQGTHPFSDEGIRERAERGELQLGGESFGPSSGTFFEGPDMRDPEVRATVAYMTSTFKIHPLDPEAPDMWVDNVSDALFSSGMSAIYLAADCREKSEVPVRTRIGVELIPLWKQAFAWTVVRRSLQSVQAIYNRTKRCPKGDLEGLVRMVLEYVQKRTQGVETRLRDEVAAAQLVNYPSLKAYISDLETKFNKLMTNGVTITDSEQRHLLLRGLTPEYHGVKASILTYRNRYNRPADFTETVAMLEDFEDNTMQVTSRTFTNNREVTLMTGDQTDKPAQENNSRVCFHFSKSGSCRRGRSCRFRHVERPTTNDVSKGRGNQQKRQKVPSEHYRRPNSRQGRGAGNARKTGNCHNCGKAGHWAKDCRIIVVVEVW